MLRRMDQAAVAVLVLLALVGMGVYWIVQGGPRGELIDIDRADPLSARYLVDINKADWPELAELPEIGETLARRIVDSRLKDGAFRDHDDLRRVRGIGPRKLDGNDPALERDHAPGAELWIETMDKGIADRPGVHILILPGSCRLPTGFPAAIGPCAARSAAWRPPSGCR